MRSWNRSCERSESVAARVDAGGQSDEFRSSSVESAATLPLAARGPECRSDEEIDAFVRRTAITAHHPCATCAMGTGEDAVLDPALRVRGVEALRVVDASAMPDLVSGNINACVLMIAEKAADFLLGTPASG